MANITKEELTAAHEQQLPWLRQQAGYTCSYLSQDSAGHWLLVIGLDPVTPATKAVIEERLRACPLEVRPIPMGRAYASPARPP